VFFFRVDDKFVPLKTTNDISSRLEWEKPKTEALRKWLDEHLPKGTTNALKQVSPVQPEKNRQSINNVSKAKSPSRQ
jgi:hypothetical protein